MSLTLASLGSRMDKMNLACWFGVHDWDCVKCKRCGKLIDDQMRNEKSTTFIPSRDRPHDWEGCKCRICGSTDKYRNDGHTWIGCKCSVCGRTKESWEEGHDWDGCQCRTCGTVRGTGHELQGKNCICRRCHCLVHQWDHCTCTRCGDVQDSNHNWSDGKCLVCGKAKSVWDGVVIIRR